MSVCLYTSPFPDSKMCGIHTEDSEEYCIFHRPRSSPSKLNARDFVLKLLEQYHRNKNGNWSGFEFPDGIRFETLVLDYELNLKYAKFNGVTFANVHFKSLVDFSYCTLGGEVTLDCTFDDMARFDGCEFKKQVLIRGRFNSSASFRNSTFHDAVTFLGGDDIGLNGNVVYDRKLFYGDVSMSNVIFFQPNRTRFLSVDLSKTHFTGTDVKGVYFYNITWYRNTFGRRSLYDEFHSNSFNPAPFPFETVFREFKKFYKVMLPPWLFSFLFQYRKFNQSSIDYYQKLLPRLEGQYRNFRVALEDSKDYVTAKDFYVGEMDKRRLQMGFFRKHLFSVEAIYNALSLYGSSIWRAVRFMGYFIILHTLLSWMLQNNVVIDGSTYFTSWQNIIQTGFTFMMRSLNILTFQREGWSREINECQFSLDTVFRIVGPIQVALVVLAIRSRIKRH